MKRFLGLILALITPLLAFGAAGDVSSSEFTLTYTKANFVALTATGTTAAYSLAPTFANNHTVQIVVTGTPATCTVTLQGSLDGVTYTDLSPSQTCTSGVQFFVRSKPVTFIRVNLSALSGGSSPTVTVFYLGQPNGGASNFDVSSGTASAVSQPGTPMLCDTATSGTVTAGQAQMVRCLTSGVLATGLSAPAVDGSGYTGGALVGSNGAQLVPVVIPELVSTGTSLYSRQYICDKTAKLNALAAATTQIVALAASQKIYVCSMVVSNNNATPTTLKLVEGTGSNCVTGQTDVTALMNIGATSTAPIAISLGANAGWVTTTAADALCATSSAASSLEITITYVQHN